MRRILPALCLCLLLWCPTARAGVRLLAFYEVKPAEKPPTIDGVFDDACWTGVPTASTYFEYWKADPRPGVLKTDFRMVYGSRGIYLAINNYDKLARKARRERTSRDDPGLWKDDCAEIYFDPTAKGVGFTKFVTNAAGVQGDMRRVDAAVFLRNWSGSGWTVATKVHDDRWTIEAFFPYSDLGAVAKQGDLWTFDHVRYAWTTGKFRGVTWAAEGNYNRPENFGYLYFGGKDDLAAEKVGTMLSRQVAPPWSMIVEKGFITCEQAGRAEYVGAAERVASQRRALQELLERTGRVIGKADLPDPKKRFRPVYTRVREAVGKLPGRVDEPLEALEALRTIAALTEEVEQAYWEARIASLLNQTE